MITQALEMLKAGTVGSLKMPKDQTMVIVPNAIVVKYFSGHSGLHTSVLVAKVGGQLIGNSSKLSGLLNHRGEYKETVTPEQLELSDLLPMIPFDVISMAKLSLTGYQLVDRGPEETVHVWESRHNITDLALEKLKADPKISELKETDASGWGEKRFDVSYKRARHFTGAQLFRIGQDVFLLDVDRVELKHGIMNPFMVRLNQSVTVYDIDTIAKAYESLKPREVYDAETLGLQILRQGEWFFIPTNIDIDSTSVTQGMLRAGDNRPNRVQMHFEREGQYFVKGTVSHTGREHKDLNLKTWYRAVPNTAQTSWTITGDID